MLFQIKLTYYELILLNTVIGLVLGLIPLIFGILRGRVKIGLIGFIGSIIGGTILGIFLVIPITGFCTYLILKKRPDAD